MNEIFTFVENNTYNLRSGMHLSMLNVHSTQYGMESIGNLGAKINSKWIPYKCFSPYERFKGSKYI